MNPPRLLPLLGALLLSATVTHAPRAAGDAAQQRLELNQAIQRQILSLNINQTDKYLIDYSFSTFHGMYAYRELLLWAQADSGRHEELLALVREGLEAVIRDSGLGIPIEGSEGQSAGLLFGRGLPRYTQKPDFSHPETLAWNPASFEKQIAPESIGQSLAAKSLYLTAGSPNPGGKPEDILLASALHEFQALPALLELGGDREAGHMPALLKLENGNWTAIAPSSQLSGQMALIQGLVHLHALLSLPALESQTIAGRRLPEWRKEVRRVLEKAYHATARHHLDSKAGSFAGSHDRDKGPSDRLGAADAGYALEVLADLVTILPKDDPLRADALGRLTMQADYVLARLDGKTVAPRTFLLKTGQSHAGPLLRLEDQIAIVNGLLAAGQASGREQYGSAALAIFNSAREALWSAPAGIFRSAAGQTVAAYDGRLFGMVLAAWRRLENTLPPGEARQHGDKHIERVLRQGGLLQCEGPATGEPKQPETFIRDDLPPLVESIASLKREEQAEKIAAAVKTLSDQDGDGVPGCRFGGGRFGAAPVIIVQTSVKTPFPPPPPTSTPPRSTP